MSEAENYLEFAKELAEEASQVMKKYFRAEDTQTELKSDATLVTIADTKINELVISEVNKRFPGHAVLGEEASHESKSDYLWVCDPIDGTLPFTIGIPVSTFNLALVHKGSTIVAVQKDPATDRLYWAEKNKGAYLNGEKLKMTGQFLGRIPINCEIYAHEYNSLFDDQQAESEIQTALKAKDFVLMKLISVGNSVGLVASGHLAAAIFSNQHAFEAATGSLLVTEAGGKFTSLLGEVEKYDQKISGFVAAHESLHGMILETIEPIVNKYKVR